MAAHRAAASPLKSFFFNLLYPLSIPFLQFARCRNHSLRFLCRFFSDILPFYRFYHFPGFFAILFGCRTGNWLKAAKYQNTPRRNHILAKLFLRLLPCLQAIRRTDSFPILKSQADVEIKGLMVSLNRMERGKGTRSALDEIKDLYGFSTAAIVSMADVVEHLYNKEINGKVVIDDQIKAAIDAYYEQYGAQA